MVKEVLALELGLQLAACSELAMTPVCVSTKLAIQMEYILWSILCCFFITEYVSEYTVRCIKV